MLTGTNIIRKLQQENIRLQSENSTLNKQFKKVQKSLHSMVKLHQRLQTIGPETNVFNLINHVLTCAMEAAESVDGSLALLDEKSGDLVFVEVLGQARDVILNLKLSEDQGVAHWCIKNKLPRLVEDTRREKVYSPAIDNISPLKSSSLICIPMLFDNRPLGVIEVINTISGRPFNDADKDIMMVVGYLAAMIIASAENQ